MCALCLVATLGRAQSSPQAAWIELGDTILRHDLRELVDSGVLTLPLTTWPMPMTDLLAAFSVARTDRLTTETGRLAWQRVQHRIGRTAEKGFALEWQVNGGRSDLMRDVDGGPREKGELGLRWARDETRWSMALALEAVAAASDGKSVRADQSFFTGRVGNWLLGVSLQDRHWGPAYESSLILSNNARPIPAVVFDRAVSAPPEWRGLHWIGAWRATGMLGILEQERHDIDRPLFFGLRITWQPRHWFELGLSRTAQLCGAGRPCDIQTFTDMLLGNDNIGGGGNVSAERQPGNQLAGLDARLSSPWKAFPVAFYWQDIGEDVINKRPTDRLHLFGVQAWMSLSNGVAIRGYAEYADTSCDANLSPPAFDCAYTNNLFNAEGYRFHGRAIGHTTDADSESRAAGIYLIEPSGREWRVRVRNSAINRGGSFDPWHSLSSMPAKYDSIDVSVRQQWMGSNLELQLGVESLRGTGHNGEVRPFGHINWRKSLGSHR